MKKATQVQKVSLFAVVFFVALSLIIESLAKKKDADQSVGKKAMEITEAIVAIGPRDVFSDGIKKTRKFLEKEVKKLGFKMERDSFQAVTPLGQVEMVNFSYLIPAKDSKRIVLLTAHYDGKKFDDFTFVGANDAASSVALLLALTPEIKKNEYPFDIEIVFLDGEEAIVRWSYNDSLYGSRYLASKLTSLERYGKGIKAAIVVDMIGDKDLTLINNRTSDPVLSEIMREAAKEIGKGDLVDTIHTWVADDHIPLMRIGIPTLHVMDFTFPYWHTKEDTMDKISAKSLDTVGDILLRVLKKLAK